jgi:cob(I)alamin adenosyltransferase
MSVYTKKGDQGQTRLLSGEKVSKASIRIRAIGSIDELSAYLGMLRSLQINQNCKNFLIQIQADLVKIAGILADPKGKFAASLPSITSDDVEKLENQIDKYEALLGKQKFFVLPGGTQEIAFAHIARTVCRRAESDLVHLSQQSDVPLLILKYINRLSDYLYMLARFIAHEQNYKEDIVRLRN